MRPAPPCRSRLRDSSFDLAKLQATVDAFVANASTQSSLQRVQATLPLQRAAIHRRGRPREDRRRCTSPLDQVFAALAGYLGSSYVDQFNKFGRTFQIYVQADSQFRLRVEDIANLTVRNSAGNMIPLGTLVTVTPTVGPSLISLYNLYPSASVIATARGRRFDRRRRSS